MVTCKQAVQNNTYYLLKRDNQCRKSWKPTAQLRIKHFNRSNEIFVWQILNIYLYINMSQALPFYMLNIDTDRRCVPRQEMVSGWYVFPACALTLAFLFFIKVAGDLQNCRKECLKVFFHSTHSLAEYKNVVVPLFRIRIRIVWLLQH